MIAGAPFPLLLLPPRRGCLTGRIHLKLQASSLRICKWPVPSFRSCTTPASLLCECMLDHNGSHLQPTWASKVEIATTFIEDKLIDALSQKAGEIRQIVLLTDGVDHRPCKLMCPPMTVIYHISSQSVIQASKGAEVPKSCLIRYVQAELEESAGLEGWTDRVRNAGYQGDKPSVWAVQGIDFAAQSKLRKILENAGSLMMQGSLLIGELPSTNFGGLNEDAASQLLDKIFMGCGFRIKSVLFKQLSTNKVDGVHILFVAEQLRLSDDQVKKVMREVELAEEAGDEETFEDW